MQIMSNETYNTNGFLYYFSFINHIIGKKSMRRKTVYLITDDPDVKNNIDDSVDLIICNRHYLI